MKRLLILLVLGLFSFVQDQANGCGWYIGAEEFRFWLLQPDLADTRDLHPFYFTTEIFNGPDEQELKEVAYNMNLAEWRGIVGPAVPEDAIAAILYGTAPEDFWKNEQQLFSENAFLQRLTAMSGGWPEFIRYAKTGEQLVNYRDPWGFQEKDERAMRNAWNSGRKLLKKSKDPVLSARIAFLMVRLAFYAPELKLDAQAVYEKELAPLRGKTWLEPSAAFYLASMQQNPARDMAFSELFDRAPDKRFRMVQLFDNSATEEYITQAKSEKQRATLLVMRDLQHPGRALKDLERIAAWDPGNEHLPLLLCREVNKLEDWLLTQPLTGYGSAIRQWSGNEEGLSDADIARADLVYLQEVKVFIVRILPQATPAQRPLLLLLDGHLSFIAGDMNAVRTAMERVEKEPLASAEMRVQARVDLVLSGIMASHKLTDATRADFMDLIALVKTSPTLAANSSNLLDQLHLFLGKKLIVRGEMAEGAFLLARSGRAYTSTASLWGANARHVVFEQAVPADYDRMITLLDKPDKTRFEQYLTGTGARPDDPGDTADRINDNELTRNKLLDYKATWFLREGQLEQAAAVFQQIPDEFWAGFPYALFADDDPFVVNIEDPHNYNKTDSARYNKRTIVERMISLQREADRDPSKRALNHYLLGNAYYNMSWHGKYWIMSRISWSIWEMSQWRDRETTAPGDADYFGDQRAQRHYLIAMKEAKDPVLQAMACRMAEECERNWWNFTGEGGMDEAGNPYQAKLTSQESQEAYRAIEDCSGYADFVARFR